MSDETFSVEESAALPHAILANYPNTSGMKPIQEIGEFPRTLRTLRAGATFPCRR
jgi:hypothetical protein